MELLAREGYQYVAVFDADFKPEADFLEKTIPYLEGNPEVRTLPALPCSALRVLPCPTCLPALSCPALIARPACSRCLTGLPVLPPPRRRLSFSAFI